MVEHELHAEQLEEGADQEQQVRRVAGMDDVEAAPPPHAPAQPEGAGTAPRCIRAGSRQPAAFHRQPVAMDVDVRRSDLETPFAARCRSGRSPTPGSRRRAAHRPPARRAGRRARAGSPPVSARCRTACRRCCRPGRASPAQSFVHTGHGALPRPMRTRSITTCRSRIRCGSSTNSCGGVAHHHGLGMIEQLVHAAPPSGATDAGCARGCRCGWRRSTRARFTLRSYTRMSKPLPSSRSVSSTTGLPRRSSVPALKLMPRMPTLRRPAATTASTARSICRSLLGSTAARIGVVTSALRAAAGQRAQVLRQAVAAEGETRPQIGGGDVQLAVQAEDVHHAMRIHAEGLAQRADLVGEADLQRMPGIVGVLHHLGGFELGAHQSRRAGRRRSCASTSPLARLISPITVLGGL